MSEHTLPQDDQDVKDAVASVFGSDALALLNTIDDLPSLESEDGGARLEDVVAQLEQEVDASGDLTGFGTQAAVSRRQTTGAKHVVVALGDTRLALPMSHVLEVQRVPGVTVIPNVPDWLQGVTNLRGEIISVVDLRSLLGMETNEQDAARRLVVVRSLESDLLTGLIVDRVAGLQNIESRQVIDPTAPVDSSVARYLKGVVAEGDHLTCVVNLDALLESEELNQFEAA